MARKFWVVLVEKMGSWHGGDYRGQMFLPPEQCEMFSVFTDESSAHHWAKEMAASHPKYDVQIYEPVSGYCCQPSEAQKKIWKEGKFIPAEAT